MNKTDLQLRKESFKVLTDRFENFSVSDLISSFKIDESKFVRLRRSIKTYLDKCAGIQSEDKFLRDHDRETLLYFEENYQKIPCITPNGLVMPKNNTILEYNLVCQSFYDIIKDCNIDDLVESWHIPLNVRIKLGKPLESNMSRDYPTEWIHSDSWAGENSHSVTTMIPIMGDTNNNFVQYYDPPENFSEDWLGPKPSYKEGSDIASKYKKLDYKAQKGQLVFVDFSTLHSSSREEEAGIRVSIDTTFVLKRENIKDKKEHPWRNNERASIEVVNNIGKKYLFNFPDEPTTINDNMGGFKHSSNLYISSI